MCLYELLILKILNTVQRSVSICKLYVGGTIEKRKALRSTIKDAV
jgi:hypothetical protein